MNVIGLTGTIGSGKSTVSKYLEEKGYSLIDADQISKELMKKNKKGYKKVLAKFTKSILTADNEIDRSKLSEIVFNDPDKLQLLNDLLHPLISEEVNRQVQECFHLGEDIVFLDAPLLIESGLYKDVDKVILIKADRVRLLDRIQKRDKISRVKAQSIIEAQMPESKKEEFSDFIIENNGETKELFRQVDSILEELERF